MATPILKTFGTSSVRILRPSEYEKLRNAVKPIKQPFLDGLLLTGMRYTEAQRLQLHKDWFDGAKFIKTENKKILAQKQQGKERWIRLSNIGGLLISQFINGEKLPTRQSFDESLKRWAKKAGLTPEGFCCKTFRKTWDSWLVTAYPERITEICLSQGHDAVTQYHHYLNMPFTNEDIKDMEKWVGGWID